MATTASEECARPVEVSRDPVDPVVRVVHVALAIYLIPVVAVVCVIGGFAIALDHAARIAGRIGAKGRRTAWPGPHATARAADAGRAYQSSAGPRARAGR